MIFSYAFRKLDLNQTFVFVKLVYVCSMQNITEGLHRSNRLWLLPTARPLDCNEGYVHLPHIQVASLKYAPTNRFLQN